jgi:formate dehydrogenase subunit delta
LTEADRQAHLQPYVRLANEVAVQFPQLSDDEAAVAVAAHLRRYFEPRLRADLLAYLAAGGTDLLPIAHAAVVLLRDG